MPIEALSNIVRAGVGAFQLDSGSGGATVETGPALTYTSGALTRIDYDSGNYKTFTYDGNGVLTQLDYVVVSGVSGWSATLSNASVDLTPPLTVGATVNMMAVGNFTLAAGKSYWECSFGTQSSGALVGIALDGVPNTTYAGGGADSYAYYPVDGTLYTGGAPAANGANGGLGYSGVVGVALDLDLNTLDIYYDGVLEHTYAIPAGTYRPAMGGGSGGFDYVVANFGATAFAFTPPGGFSAPASGGTVTTRKTFNYNPDGTLSSIDQTAV